MNIQPYKNAEGESVVKVIAVTVGHYEFLRAPGEIFEFPAALLKQGALPSWLTATTAVGPVLADAKTRARAFAKAPPAEREAE